MAMMTVSPSVPPSIAQTMQTYFSKKLLEVQMDNLRLSQFGMKASLPAKSNTKTIRWFKPSGVKAELKASATNNDSVFALTEGGQTIGGSGTPQYREISYTYVEATLNQYGEAAKVSDVLDLISAYEPLQQVVQTFGLDAAMSADTMCRTALLGSEQNNGTAFGAGLSHACNNAVGRQCERFAGVDWDATNNTSVNCFNALRNLNNAAAKVSRATLLGAVTRLAANKAPTFGGRYIAVICPQIRHDLAQDPDYLRAFQGAGFKGPFNGAIGNVDGLEFVEATNPFLEGTTYGTYSAEGNIYSTVVLGANAFGVPQLAGTSSPYKPAVTILREADKSDPLNQFILAGWKVFYAVKGLDPLNLVVVRSKTTFV